MIFNEIIKESRFNAWNRLIQTLDRIFGFKSNGKAKVRRIRQKFDQKNGEHVILLEYRVKAANQSPIRINRSRVNLVSSPSQKE